MNIYPWQPFVEAREIGRYIKKHTDPRDYVYVWAEEPEIFFYSERRSIDRYWKNTPFIYFSSFFPDAPIEVITLLKNKRPKYIVVDTRHIEALRYFKEIGDFIQKDYVIEAEFKVIRDKIWGYSLLAFRIKETS